MKPFAVLTALLLCLAVPATAFAAKGHVHGTGTLDVAVDQGRLAIDLELPLDAATGFERAPRNAAEKAALEETARVLNDAATLFTPTAAANCRVTSVEVTVPFLDGKGPADGHADIDARYRFECATPGALKGVETSLFRHFKRLYRLQAQRSGPGGQGAARLTPKQPALSW